LPRCSNRLLQQRSHDTSLAERWLYVKASYRLHQFRFLPYTDKPAKCGPGPNGTPGDRLPIRVGKEPDGRAHVDQLAHGMFAFRANCPGNFSVRARAKNHAPAA
jgi:hypothetical protein